jgi:hypothetical protein
MTTDLHKEVERLKAENAQMREALAEISKPPYRDSDLKSLNAWMRLRALSAIPAQTPPESGAESAPEDRCDDCRTPLTFYPESHLYICEGCGQAGMGEPKPPREG